MAPRRRGILILGWLCAIGGYGFALLLIRGIFLGFTRGFGASRSQAFWIVSLYVLFLAVSTYLINIGRRAISLGKGFPRPEPRFGWGRILIGAVILYTNAVRHFNLIPARFPKPLETPNNLEALAMNITVALIYVACFWLIFSGIWKGLRRQARSNVSA